MHNQEFENLTNRYFRGQLSDNEYELLKDYLRDSNYLEIFQQAKSEWNLNPEINEMGRRNWNRLEYKINSLYSTQPAQPTYRLWIRVVSVAAILAIGLFIGAVLTNYFKNENSNQEELVFETPRGQKSLVRLPDGTQVWLNAKSRLVYHSFSSKQRQVELKGEAFFKVTRNENAPFLVKTDRCEVKVLGTTFNVMAYNEFGRQEITLLSGKVNVRNENFAQDIEPGQSLILKGNVSKVVTSNVVQASAWIENKFNFQNIPLTELMKRLENWYDVDITLENLNGREVNYTGTFKNEETIWQVLDAIKVYTPIQYKKTNLRKITISVR